ncbi:MAG: tetratricopeptide repeat protein [Steroidobacteraceae bacterium]|jgi:tetratricopeptide (TPR) repeat protein|nr:tetratricopeptide repeat protein [Steroidobacteraceae bacterium]MBP7014158.1 tetratricopeptide repeat protein [Steroidobacteraceae bacterium]
MHHLRHFAIVCASLFSAPLLAAGASVNPSFDAELLSIQQAWAKVNYETPAGDERTKAFDALEKRAENFTHQNPTRPEALIWEGIVESSYAGARGGLGALALCKEARGNLEAALKLDPNALDGSAYTSLGTLYYKVPGFPLGFGDDEKAGKLLQKALALNPNGIDPNYFYAEYLFEQGRYPEALPYLDKAGKAAPRPGREVADKGRRGEIAALTAKVKAKSS